MSCMWTPIVSSRPVCAGVETFSGNGTPSDSKSSLVTAGAPPGICPVIGCADWPIGTSEQSAALPTRGLPARAGSVRQLLTPGYGCETGPGNQRSSTATGKLDVHGTNRSWYEVIPKWRVVSGLGTW